MEGIDDTIEIGKRTRHLYCPGDRGLKTCYRLEKRFLWYAESSRELNMEARIQSKKTLELLDDIGD